MAFLSFFIDTILLPILTILQVVDANPSTQTRRCKPVARSGRLTGRIIRLIVYGTTNTDARLGIGLSRGFKKKKIKNN